MERRRLADIFPISKALLNQAFGDEPSPLHFRFQAASGVRQPAERSGVAKLKPKPAFQAASETMTAIGDQWRQCAALCVKQCKKPSENGCAEIAAFLRGIADKEEALWRALKRKAA